MERTNTSPSLHYLARKSTKNYLSVTAGFKSLLTKSASSIYPSYTHLQLPYEVVCRQRYQKAIRDQQKQFIKEIKMHEELQPQALSGVKLYREFCNPILKKVSTKDMIKLTVAEERRVEYLLKTDPRDL